MLLGLTLTNFEGFRALELGLGTAAWMDAVARGADAPLPVALEPLSILIGRNAAGKSSIFRALGLVQALMHHDLSYAMTLDDAAGFSQLHRHGATEPLTIEVLLSCRDCRGPLAYRLAIVGDRHGRPRIVEESLRALPPLAVELNGGPPAEAADLSARSSSGQPEPETLFTVGPEAAWLRRADGEREALSPVAGKQANLASLGRLYDLPGLRQAYYALRSWYNCRFDGQDATLGPQGEARREGLARQRAHGGGHRRLNEDASNIANVLAYHRARDKRAYAAMMRRLSEQHPAGEALERRFAADELSQSELRLFALLLLLEDPDPRPLLLIESPDHGLYHDNVARLGERLRAYTLRHPDTQLPLSTHNPVFLEHFAPREVWLIDREAEPAARVSSALPLVQRLYDEGVGMAAIWYGGYIDGEDDRAPS